MSTLWIVIILLVPIIVIIILLNRTHKKQLQKIDKRNSVYLQQVLGQTGITISFQKHVVHQRVLLDKVNRKLVIIDHIDNTYSYKMYDLDTIKNMEVQHVRQVVDGEGKNRKSETLTSQVGLQIVADNGSSSKQLIVFYDHMQHNVFLMSDMEKEAGELRKIIKEAIISKAPVS